MAWIKMRSELATDPAVIGIAMDLGCEEDLVVGKLHRLWAWADTHTSDGCPRTSGQNADKCPPVVRGDWIDRFLGAPGFAAAMMRVGWLAESEDGLIFPDFEKHNGETAKKRASEARRKASGRNVSAKRPPKSGQVSAKSRTSVREKAELEKRREEKRRKEENPPTPLPIESHQRDEADPVTPSERHVHQPDTDRAWEALPGNRRRNRTSFRDAWVEAMRANPPPDPDEIIDALTRYYASPQGTGRYARSAARFIREEGWHEPEEAWSDEDTKPSDEHPNRRINPMTGKPYQREAERA